MPWTEKSVMNRRLCFIAACLRDDEPMSDLCRRFGVSRKTGYKWLGRYHAGGAAGLEDLSSARLAGDRGGHRGGATDIAPTATDLGPAQAVGTSGDGSAGG